MSSNEDSDGRWLLSAIKLPGYCVVFVELTQSRRYGDVIVMFFLSDTRHEFHPVRQDVAATTNNVSTTNSYEPYLIIRTSYDITKCRTTRGGYQYGYYSVVCCTGGATATACASRRRGQKVPWIRIAALSTTTPVVRITTPLQQQQQQQQRFQSSTLVVMCMDGRCVCPYSEPGRGNTMIPSRINHSVNPSMPGYIWSIRPWGITTRVGLVERFTNVIPADVPSCLS